MELGSEDVSLLERYPYFREYSYLHFIFSIPSLSPGKVDCDPNTSAPSYNRILLKVSCDNADNEVYTHIQYMYLHISRQQYMYLHISRQQYMCVCVCVCVCVYICT